MEATFPPSSQKVDASAVLGIPPENFWPYALWVADSWMSELMRLNKKRHKKLRANQEVLIFNGQNFLSLSKSLVTQLSKFQKCKHERHQISRGKDYLFLSYLHRAQLSDLYLYTHIRNGWYEGRCVIRSWYIFIEWLNEWICPLIWG